jgi:hypothetical protein
LILELFVVRIVVIAGIQCFRLLDDSLELFVVRIDVKEFDVSGVVGVVVNVIGEGRVLFLALLSICSVSSA